MLYLIVLLGGLLLGGVGMYFLLMIHFAREILAISDDPPPEPEPRPKYARWNKEAPGFQECWLWQFGPGPFEIVNHHEVPTQPRFLGVDEVTNERIEVSYDPGIWFDIATPQMALQYRQEYGLGKTTIHSQWLLPSEEGPPSEFQLYSVMAYPGWALDWHTVCYDLPYHEASAKRLEMMRVCRLKADRIRVVTAEAAEEYEEWRERERKKESRRKMNLYNETPPKYR